MSERLYSHPCPACASKLSIELDITTEFIKIRPENLDPLVRDKLAVVKAYKKIKKLGTAWEAKHGDRGIIYATELLEAVGPQGGQLDRAIGLMEWLASGSRDWDLGSAQSFFGPYQSYLIAVREAAKGPRCVVCQKASDRKLCDDHFFCFGCREGLEGKKWVFVRGEATCAGCVKPGIISEKGELF